MRRRLVLGAALWATAAAGQSPTPAIVEALDHCLAAIASRSLKPFAEWSSYAPGRYFSYDATVIAGLGTLRHEGQTVGYCLTSPGQSTSAAWIAEIDVLFEEVERRLAEGTFLSVDAEADGLLPASRRRMTRTSDEAVFAVFCPPADHPGIVIEAGAVNGFTATALLDDATFCNVSED